MTGQPTQYHFHIWKHFLFQMPSGLIGGRLKAPLPKIYDIPTMPPHAKP